MVIVISIPLLHHKAITHHVFKKSEYSGHLLHTLTPHYKAITHHVFKRVSRVDISFTI